MQHRTETKRRTAWIDGVVKADDDVTVPRTAINVDARGDVVNSSGQGASAEEKSLAEQLARNAGDVKLVVKKAS
jgi:hypothetical protein